MTVWGLVTFLLCRCAHRLRFVERGQQSRRRHRQVAQTDAGGVSDRIRVRSVVGRLLEHSRIFSFANAGDEEVYLGSPDWMPRNLYERVEVVFPVFDPLLRQRVRQEILEAYLADSAKARVLQSSGEYVRANPLAHGRRRTSPARFNAQEFLIGLAEGNESIAAIPPPSVRSPRARYRQRVEQA